MSNATQHSHQSGDSRRRRSRGGKNRSGSQQDSHRGGQREHRDNRGERGPRDSKRGSQSGRSEEFRPQAPRRTYAPPKLSWWQKLLQAVGLYKAPTPPTRAERQPEAAKPQGEPRPAKSNVRNARSGEGASPERPERSAAKRSRGGERERERPRGGDGSTVESPRVYVGNLSYDVTEQDLQELFKGIGGVRNVEIVYNRSTHRSKGYGFVEMLHMDEAVRAVEVLHDQPFMGRNLTVSGAKSRGQDEREDREERPEREARPVVVAPIPAPVSADAEPVIQTIVETVSESPAGDLAAEVQPEAEAETKTSIV